MSQASIPRQVRLIKCALLAPGLSLRASNPDDAATLTNYGFDLTPYVQQIEIFENIFEHTISGRLTLLENLGLVEYLPIVGVETVALVFSVNDSNDVLQTYSQAFRVAKVSDQTYTRHDFRVYSLTLVTNEFLASATTRVCKTYNGTASDAVQDLLKSHLRFPGDLVDIEPTTEPIRVVIPNYSPLKAINYFTILSRTQKKESNYLFFQTLKGFHFVSISHLIEHGRALGDAVPRFTVRPDQMSHGTVEDATARNAALRIHQEQTFDLLSDIASGMLRSKLVHIDFLARQMKIHDAFPRDASSGDLAVSRYTDAFDATTHLDKFPVYPKNFDLSVASSVRRFEIPSNAFMVTSAKYGSDSQPEQQLHEAVIRRNRQLHEIRHVQTLIDLPGQPNLHAGDVVDVRYPSSPTLMGKNVPANVPVYTEGTPLHSGLHLVTAVRHILTIQGGVSMEYRMNIRANRDALGVPLVGTSSTDDPATQIF